MDIPEVGSQKQDRPQSLECSCCLCTYSSSKHSWSGRPEKHTHIKIICVLQIKHNRFSVVCSYIYLKDNENGKEDEHKQQETAGVQREQVVFVWEVRLKETDVFNLSVLHYLLMSEAWETDGHQWQQTADWPAGPGSPWFWAGTWESWWPPGSSAQSQTADSKRTGWASHHDSAREGKCVMRWVFSLSFLDCFSPF